MTRTLRRRALLLVPTVVGVTLVVFLMAALSPGGFTGSLAWADSIPDAEARRIERARIIEREGLDRPVLVQFARWALRLSPVRPDDAGGILLGPPDLGRSIAMQRPVTDLIGAALPTTLALNAAALALALILAVPMGVLAAARPGSALDAGLRAGSIALWSCPVVLAAVLLQGTLGPAGLGWFPSTGLHAPGARDLPFWSYALDTVRHAALPVVCLALTSLALISRQTRSAVLEQLGAPHARAAIARGVPALAVLLRHGLRPGLLPVVTLVSGMLPGLLAGSLVVERVFNLPGMGALVLHAVDHRDRDVLMACVLMASLVTIGATLLADLLAAALDPRVDAGGPA